MDVHIALGNRERIVLAIRIIAGMRVLGAGHNGRQVINESVTTVSAVDNDPSDGWLYGRKFTELPARIGILIVCHYIPPRSTSHAPAIQASSCAAVVMSVFS